MMSPGLPPAVQPVEEAVRGPVPGGAAAVADV